MPIIQKLAKQAVKSAVKKKLKKKVSSQARLERMLRSENRGDARVAGRIKQLREKEQAGLISPGERQRALNRMTKSNKEMVAKRKTGKKISGVRQTKVK